MLLADLARLYEQLLAEGRLMPPGYQRKPVRLLIELDPEGHCVGAVDAEREGPELVVPVIARSRNIVASIVVDKGQYVLGVAQTADPPEQAKALRSHEQYVSRLAQARTELSGAAGLAARLTAVRRFVADAAAARAVLEARGIAFEVGPDGVFPHAGALVRFRVAGVDPVDDPVLQEWWAAVVSADLSTGRIGACQVTGLVQPLARLMPVVVGAGGKNPRLISSNFKAAERYGGSQASGSHVGVATAVHTHQALNWLLEDPGHHRQMGGLTFVWWVDEALEFDPFTAAFDPSDSLVALMASAWRGRRATLGSAVFRLLVLTVTEARIVVRLDHVVALDDLQRRIERWLALVEVTGRGGAKRRVPIKLLAESATGPGSGNARQAQRDRLVGDLAVALVTGSALSERLRNAAVIRCRAERLVPPDRAALLRICQRFQEVEMSDHQPTSGELCGRLLAQLEQAQWAALGDTNRTVTDRYYAKASVNPEQVFPQLLRGAQAHLSKAGRRSKGAQVAISRRLGDLASQIQMAGGIPQALTMREQADFALGYWQEREERFARSSVSKNPDETTDEEGQ